MSVCSGCEGKSWSGGVGRGSGGWGGGRGGLPGGGVRGGLRYCSCNRQHFVLTVQWVGGLSAIGSRVSLSGQLAQFLWIMFI